MNANNFWDQSHRIRLFLLVLFSGLVFGGAISYLLNRLGY